MSKLHTIKLKGPISVAYRKVKNLHMCNALQFDLVGTGETKEEAFREMKELLEEYIFTVVEAMRDGEKVRFFNLADNDEWNNSKEITDYEVTFVVLDSVGDLTNVNLKNIAKLAPYRDAMKAVDLVPA